MESFSIGTVMSVMDARSWSGKGMKSFGRETQLVAAGKVRQRMMCSGFIRTFCCYSDLPLMNGGRNQ